MSMPISLRLTLDIVAVSLLLVALAYDWMGNAVHEVIGTVTVSYTHLTLPTILLV